MKGVLLLALLPLAYGQIIGGYTHKEITDTDVQKAATFVTTTLAATLTAANVELKLVRAESQVVAGVNYRLHYTKTDTTTHAVTNCVIVVYEVAWENKTSITRNTCVHPSKRQLVIPGGVAVVNLAAPETQAALAFAVDALNGRSNNLNRLSLVHVLHATQQIVAGVLYKFDLELGESTCKNDQANHGKTITDCPVSATAMKRKCHLAVVWQAWMTPQYSLSDFNCN